MRYPRKIKSVGPVKLFRIGDLKKRKGIYKKFEIVLRLDSKFDEDFINPKSMCYVLREGLIEIGRRKKTKSNYRAFESKFKSDFFNIADYYIFEKTGELVAYRRE